MMRFFATKNYSTIWRIAIAQKLEGVLFEHNILILRDSSANSSIEAFPLLLLRCNKRL